MNQKHVIINADDYGLTAGVSYGILEAHLKGIVTSTTALPVSEHFLEAMELAEKFPTLKIGIHLGLTLQKTKPILGDKVPSLIQADGTFHRNRDLLKHIKLEEVELEWRAQIEHFYSTGHTPTHLDSHHNVHCYTPELFNLAKKLAKEYQLPLRNFYIGNPQDKIEADISDIITTAPTDQSFYGMDNITLKRLDTIFKNISMRDETYFEVNCHPAFVDQSLKDKSGYLYERLKELDLLRTSEVKSSLEKYNLKLSSFDQIK